MPVSSWFFSSRNKHTWISTIIPCTKVSACVSCWALWTETCTSDMKQKWPATAYRAIYPEGLSVALTLWGEDHWNLPEDARGTDDSMVIMTSRQTLKNTCNSTHITGPGATTNDALVSLTLPRQVHSQGVYVNSTWLGRTHRTVWPRGGRHN